MRVFLSFHPFLPRLMAGTPIDDAVAEIDRWQPDGVKIHYFDEPHDFFHIYRSADGRWDPQRQHELVRTLFTEARRRDYLSSCTSTCARAGTASWPCSKSSQMSPPHLPPWLQSQPVRRASRPLSVARHRPVRDRAARAHDAAAGLLPGVDPSTAPTGSCSAPTATSARSMTCAGRGTFWWCCGFVDDVDAAVRHGNTQTFTTWLVSPR